MRILHYINYHNGGITRYTEEVLRAMSPSVDNCVICPPDTEIDVTNCKVYPSLVDLRKEKNRWGGRVQFLISQIWNPVQLIRAVKGIQPDVIHFGNVNHLTYPYWGRCLASLGIPFVLTVHDVTREKAMVSKSWEEKQLIAIYNDASTLFVHSRAQQLELAAMSGVDKDKIIVVPHGVYDYPIAETQMDVRVSLGIPPNVEVGLAFGGVRDDKGVRDLILALAKLPDTHLIVAGRSASKMHRPVSFYRDLAKQLDIQHRVHFVESFIPDEHVEDYFRAVDWCGLVYSDTFTSQSGVLCTAVNFQTPVLVAASPTLVETVEKYEIGLVAVDSSGEALASAMKKFGDMKKNQNSFSFKKFKAESSWNKNAEMTEKSYQKLLKH